MAPVSPNRDKDAFKNVESTFDSEGRIESGKEKKKNGLLPKILSVIAAIALWLYVFQAVEEELVFKEIPITLENFNTNLELDVVSGYESTLDVTVSGTKSMVSEITSKDIKASVDLSSVTERGTYVLDVNVEAPSTVKIVGKSVTQLKISVDKTVEKVIELEPVLSYNIQYPYELGEIALAADTVTLKGPETDINAVARATVQLDLGSVKNNILSNAEVTLYDENNYEIQSKYIIITPSAVEVSLPVNKTALFAVQADVVLDKEKFEYTVTPASLYLKGAVNDVEALTALKTQRAWIDAPGEYELSLMLADNVSAYTAYSASEDTRVQTVKLTVTEKPVEPAVQTTAQDGEPNG